MLASSSSSHSEALRETHVERDIPLERPQQEVGNEESWFGRGHSSSRLSYSTANASPRVRYRSEVRAAGAAGGLRCWIAAAAAVISRAAAARIQEQQQQQEEGSNKKTIE